VGGWWNTNNKSMTSAANPSAAAAAIDRRDKQTDGRTDGHSAVLWRLPHIMRTAQQYDKTLQLKNSNCVEINILMLKLWTKENSQEVSYSLLCSLVTKKYFGEVLLCPSLLRPGGGNCPLLPPSFVTGCRVNKTIDVEYINISRYFTGQSNSSEGVTTDNSQSYNRKMVDCPSYY